MICDSTAILESIKRQLAGGSPCEDQLLELIPIYWDMTAAEGCYNQYLHALLTKREAILALMGCEATNVDTYDRHRQMNAVTKADSVNDTRTQAQSTGNSTVFRTGHGETRYDETNYARTRGDMDRHGIQTETGDGTSVYRDDGTGSGFNNSGSTNEIDAVDVELTTVTTTGGSEERGYRSDCNYEYSTNNSKGQAAGVPPIFSGSFTGSGSEWRKFTRTRAFDRDQSTHQTDQARTRQVNDERRGSGTHSWGSFFNSDIEWHDRDFEIRTGHDRTDVRRHAEAQAQGNGDGMSEDRTKAHNASQGTAKSEYTSNATRTMNRTDTTTVVELKNSQRFRNLMLLYDNLTLQIDRLKQRLRARAAPAVATMPCICGSCCRCVGGSAYRACKTAWY